MAINTFIDNVRLNETNSLVHLLDKVEQCEVNEAGINLGHLKYFNELYFINSIEQYNIGSVMISLNT